MNVGKAFKYSMWSAEALHEGDITKAKQYLRWAMEDLEEE